MSDVGKWGITRNDDGSLADLWDWPWYWRYPIGLVALVASVLLGFYLDSQGKSEWFGIAVGGVCALGALSLMRELGCLLIVLVGLGLGYWLLTYLIGLTGLEDLSRGESEPSGDLVAFLTGFFAFCAALFGYKCFDALEKMKEANHRARFHAQERLEERLSAIESQIWELRDSLRYRE